MTLIETRDARGIIAFSGLGQVGSFRTERWLLETLAEVAPPEYTLGAVFHRLGEKAAEKVSNLKNSGQPLTSDERRLSFYFAGYGYPDGEAEDPRIAYCILSNFERLGERLTGGSLDTFEISGEMEVAKEARTGDAPAAVLVGGNHRAVASADTAGLMALLEKDAPMAALVGKVVDLIRETGRRREAGGTIGDDVLTAVIPSAASEGAVLSHHPPRAAPYLTAANMAHVAGEDDTWLARDFRFEAQGAKVVPKLGRNERCWCGSGLKFKRCHGA